MPLLLSLAIATPAWVPVWSGAVDTMGSMPQVELLGVDEEGDTAWLRVSDGPRRTRALWQIDLHRGRRTGVWKAGTHDDRPAFGALSPLVGNPSDLARFGLLQAHIAGRPSWPALSLDPQGRWFAWEHGDDQGADAVTLRTEGGPARLGDAAWTAVYRPRFHPDAPWVAYTASTPQGDYEVVVESVEGAARVSVEGLSHASQLDWDAHGALWATGEGCVSRVPADELRLGEDPTAPVAEAVACGSDTLHTRMSPDGLHIIVADPDPSDPGQLLVGRFRTTDGSLVGHARIPSGRSVQGLSDEGWLLVTTREGTVVAAVDDGGSMAIPLDVPALGGVHDHWPGGRTLAMVWDPTQRLVTLGWAQPPKD